MLRKLSGKAIALSRAFLWQACNISQIQRKAIPRLALSLYMGIRQVLLGKALNS